MSSRETDCLQTVKAFLHIGTVQWLINPSLLNASATFVKPSEWLRLEICNVIFAQQNRQSCNVTANILDAIRKPFQMNERSRHARRCSPSRK